MLLLARGPSLKGQVQERLPNPLLCVLQYHRLVPMGKHDATLDQIRRLNAGLHWNKVEALLRSLGAEVYEGSGSAMTFVLEDRKLTVDRPHPRKECGIGLVKRIRRFLSELGHL